MSGLDRGGRGPSIDEVDEDGDEVDEDGDEVDEDEDSREEEPAFEDETKEDSEA